MKKIVESIKVPKHYKVKTDSGFEEVNFIHRTVKYDVWKLCTESFTLKCADNHIVFLSDLSEKYVKDLQIGEVIKTKNGNESVIELKNSNYAEEMFDLEINSNEHRYYTNGILSHNTSLAKVLAGNYPFLYINVSDESSVETIREKITNWCSTISLLDGAERFKVVILDEMDGASDQFYKALRATIEKFANTARFIGTCNYINKVPDPVQSRFTCINFDFLSKEEEKEVMVEFIKRSWSIFKAAGITIEKDAVIEFVKRNFPDMRSILNKIQTFVVQGVKTIAAEDVKKLNYSFRDVFELVCKTGDAAENYKFLMSNYNTKVDDILHALGNELPDFIRDNHPTRVPKVPQILIKVAHYQAQRVHVIDPCISMLAAVFETQIILNS